MDAWQRSGRVGDVIGTGEGLRERESVCVWAVLVLEGDSWQGLSLIVRVAAAPDFADFDVDKEHHHRCSASSKVESFPGRTKASVGGPDVGRRLVRGSFRRSE